MKTTPIIFATNPAIPSLAIVGELSDVRAVLSPRVFMETPEGVASPDVIDGLVTFH